MPQHPGKVRVGKKPKKKKKKKKKARSKIRALSPTGY